MINENIVIYTNYLTNSSCNRSSALNVSVEVDFTITLFSGIYISLTS